MVTGAPDNKAEAKYIKIMDPDMAIRGSLGLVVIMTPDGSAGLSEENGLMMFLDFSMAQDGSTDLRQLHGFQGQ